MKGFLGASALFGLVATALAGDFWLDDMTHQGKAPHNSQGSAYVVYRNVKTYGAKGDGSTDDTVAINAAISAGTRCGMGVNLCDSSTTSPAVVYFPAGTYMISSPIVSLYMTQMIGDPNTMPTIKGTAGFTASSGLYTLIEADRYDSANQDYGSTNVFYRQIRNLVLDTTLLPTTMVATGVHWPTAQATSLQNIVFQMSTASGNSHRGVFIENGSGGFLTDLTFYGGSHAMDVGSQQFTSRNLTFHNSVTAIYQNWDWGWTYIGLSINNCGTGIDMSSGGASAVGVGSITLLDSTISNTPIGILTARDSVSVPVTGGSLAIENVIFTNVPTAIKGPTGVTLQGTTGTMTVAAWVDGNVYSPTGPVATAASASAFPRPASLLSGTNYYTRSKPQYANLAASSFSSVRSGGAVGDGVTDDTTALQNVITAAAAAGKVVFIDCGLYKISGILYIPPGSKIVGESYPVIMGSGSLYTDITNPAPVIRVGSVAGESGEVELSDFIVSTYGANPGATLIQWNLASPATSPSGMWDVHTRIGGFTGSNLQVAQCPTTESSVNSACIGAWMSMRITNIGSGVYLENVWLWSADHDIDDATNTQINIYSGRGFSIESTTGNIWLIGTAVEHHNLYQYQFASTKNVFAGYAQTETPYYQPGIGAGNPFTQVSGRNDPDFTTYCSGKSGTCDDAWGMRVLDSTDILIYGAGFYSFFNNYNTLCSDHNSTIYDEYCQTQIFGIDEGGPSGTTYSGSSVYVYGYSTVGVVSQIDYEGTSVANQASNTGSYQETIIKFVS